ncbi:MAG: hypothetical protein CBD11_00995 [Phycisphaera sp. TMED151]|nr:MAG: hypothetical protein CBD11_00995 [Phycisphaera sp. TMED151]
MNKNTDFDMCADTDDAESVNAGNIIDMFEYDNSSNVDKTSIILSDLSSGVNKKSLTKNKNNAQVLTAKSKEQNNIENNAEIETETKNNLCESADGIDRALFESNTINKPISSLEGDVSICQFYSENDLRKLTNNDLRAILESQGKYINKNVKKSDIITRIIELQA